MSKKMIKDDGDIIRGLGFVTLYSAYLEEQIDNLLLTLNQIIKVSGTELNWQVSRKIKYIKKALKLLEFESRDDLIKNLNLCKEIFEDRNEFIHGRIYSNFGKSMELKSARYPNPNREITSEELYKLANECDDFQRAIYRPTIIEIPKAIKEMNS
jgi:hypothetical protein